MVKETEETVNLLRRVSDHFQDVAIMMDAHTERMVGFPQTSVEFVRGRAAGYKDAARVLTQFEHELIRRGGGV